MLRRLLCEVHKGGKKRDIAIVEVLANTGVRAGELARLTLEDVEVSERKGWLTVGSGKGSKYRRVPLNADARRALRQYLEMRLNVEQDHLFIAREAPGSRPRPSGGW